MKAGVFPKGIPSDVINRVTNADFWMAGGKLRPEANWDRWQIETVTVWLQLILFYVYVGVVNQGNLGNRDVLVVTPDNQRLRITWLDVIQIPVVCCQIQLV